MHASRLAPTAFCLVLAAGAARAASSDAPVPQNWPNWRGPAATGVAAAGEYPTEFSNEKHVAWKTKLPGRGTSTPAVWGDSIFLTAGIDGNNGVVCYGFDGAEKWRKTFGPEVPGKHLNGSGSNPSPTTDGTHLVAYFKSADLACLDLNGKVLWQANLAKEFGEIQLWWDLANTPLIVGKNAIVAVMHGGESYLVAYDLDSGEVAWRTVRQYKRPPESDQSYTSPQLAHVGDQDLVIAFGADHLTAHDAATGKLAWELEGFNPQNQGMWRVISSPVIADGVAVVPFARGGAIAGIRLPADGKAPDPGESRLWEKQFGADVPTPAVSGGKVYLLGDAGQLTCLALDSGEELWKANFPKAREKFYASPIIAGDLLYAIREDGAVFVGRVGDEFEQLAESDMGERVIATPIPIRKGLIIRGEEHLFRIE